MAYFTPTPKITIRPQMHVIRCSGVDVNTDHRVIEILGWPVLTETLWPRLTYPTYRDRTLEHGEILPLCIEFEGPLRRHRFEATAVVDLWGDYELRSGLFVGSFWYVRSCECGHEPRLNSVAQCLWKIRFRIPRERHWWSEANENNSRYCNGVPVDAVLLPGR